eukprot:5949172-Pleurochrysis_carterae.AAC.1
MQRNARCIVQKTLALDTLHSAEARWPDKREEHAEDSRSEAASAKEDNGGRIVRVRTSVERTIERSNKTSACRPRLEARSRDANRTKMAKARNG